MNIFFIGLGVMGGPMAGHLVKAGHNVTGFNRSHAKALTWQANHTNARLADLQTGIQNADVVISCVGNDNDIEALALDLLAHAKPNTLWIDHTTTSANSAQTIYKKLRTKSIHFLDAPVSGGESGAINGKLTIMIGGDKNQFDSAKEILNAYAKQVSHIGPTGYGQLTKMVNQICLAGVLQGLSEGLNFAKKNQMDLTKVLDAISKGAAQSWQMDNRGHTMNEDKFDFGFAIDLMLKDLNICFNQANKINAKLPSTEFIKQQYQTIQQHGFGHYDTSALIKQFTIDD